MTQSTNKLPMGQLFAENLDLLLKSRGRGAAQELASYCGVDKGYISKLKSGKKGNPDIELAVKISNFFKVRLDELMGAQEVAQLPDRRKEATLQSGINRANQRSELGDEIIAQVIKDLHQRLTACLHGGPESAAQYVRECHTRIDEFYEWSKILKSKPETKA